MLVWLSLNVLLFWKTFLLYNQGPEYYYIHQMLARIVFKQSFCSCPEPQLQPYPFTHVPDSPGLSSRITEVVPSRRTRRLLDKSKTLHITCGITICIFSGVHVAAHLVNALNFSVNYSEDFLELNAARYQNEDPRKLLFTTIPGLTGVCMVVVLFLMVTASTYAIRVSNYDIFWYTHNLFFVFYMLLLLHVSGNSSNGLLKYQTNLDTHPPGCISLNRTPSQNMSVLDYFSDHFHGSLPGGFSKLEDRYQETLVKICLEEPKFQAHFPQTWIWISGPLCLYCAERLYRCIRSNKPVTIISVINHPSDVMELRMAKENFKARPGQCPTETKATFGVHFKVVGDWTERFRDLLLPPSSQDSEILPFIQSRHYPNFWQENRPDFVNIQLYLSQTDGIQKKIGEKYHTLNSRLFIGRPRWKLLFDEIAKCNRGKTVGVFCCGPSSISKTLHNLSNRNNPYGTKFEYNKESFS
ncbi:NADPH oxidase 4 [Apodemus speciosus]|uniref:NADPH oxidase 4 n=1 Tax=Apodemus speciosus TaxID=105296 RepID=A0ABQ0EZB6_APOSI